MYGPAPYCVLSLSIFQYTAVCDYIVLKNHFVGILVFIESGESRDDHFNFVFTKCSVNSCGVIGIITLIQYRIAGFYCVDFYFRVWIVSQQ